MGQVQSQNTPLVVSYYRRSTGHGDSQKHSLTAQQLYIQDFCIREELEIIAEFSETISGSSTDRPELHKAISFAQNQGATLIIKSLSRLGRNASQVIALLDNLTVIVADKGLTCDRLTLNLLAVIDQNERERISERTKLGLQAAKAKGVKLGKSIGLINHLGRKQIESNADSFALKMEPLIMPFRVLSSRKVADILNGAGIKTRHGNLWRHKSILNLYKRIDSIKAKNSQE